MWTLNTDPIPIDTIVIVRHSFSLVRKAGCTKSPIRVQPFLPFLVLKGSIFSTSTRNSYLIISRPRLPLGHRFHPPPLPHLPPADSVASSLSSYHLICLLRAVTSLLLFFWVLFSLSLSLSSSLVTFTNTFTNTCSTTQPLTQLTHSLIL